MEEEKIDVWDGYRLIELRSELSLTSATKIMCSKKQHRFTWGKRDGDAVILVRHAIVCPFCGRRTPAYGRFLDRSRCNNTGEARVPNQLILNEWGDQLSLFLQADKTICFNYPYAPSLFACPHCGISSQPARKTEPFRISQDEACLSLAYKGNEIVFNFIAGKTVLRKDGKKTVELTFQPHAWKNDELYGFLQSNHLARKAFRAFSAMYSQKLPFTYGELRASPGRLVALTRFIGYEKDFYDQIPYPEIFDPSETAAMHYAQNVPALYDATGLPHIKSVRRLFFTRPEYLFFREEACFLWKTMKNPDFFCDLFYRSRQILPFLAFLRSYPKAEIFYEDLVKICGCRKFLREIWKNYPNMRYYSAIYASMSPVVRWQEQQLWRGSKEAICRGLRERCFLPLQRCEAIHDCFIGGFSFVWLKNTLEAKLAAQDLNNCLSEWSVYRDPVIVMRDRDGKCVAAIQVSETNLVQARVKNNDDISVGSTEIRSAFEIWKKMFRIYSDPDGLDF